MINQNSLDKNVLGKTVLDLINDKDTLLKMSNNALQIAKPNATKNIVNEILDIAQV